MRLHVTLATAVAVLSSLPGQAPGPDVLPADTQFVAHVDVQRCLRLLGEDFVDDQLREHGDDELFDVLDRVARKWSFRPLRDIVGVTVFGSSVEDDRDPSVMVWTTDAIDDMVGDLLEDGALERVRRGGVRLGRLSGQGLADALGIDEEVGDEAAWVYIHRVGDRRAILVGETADDILESARVLAGEARSLADNRRPAVEARGGRGTLAFVEVGGPLENLTREEPVSMIADRVQRLTLAVRQNDDELELRGVLDIGSRDDARNVAAVINGLRGLATLAAGEIGDEVPEVVKQAIRRVECAADGSDVVLEVSVSIDELRRELPGSERDGGRRRDRRRRIR